MAQPTPPTAEKNKQDGQTRFLVQEREYGSTNIAPPMGIHGVEHAVFVFDVPIIKTHPVVLNLSARGFDLQEYLTSHEARTLALGLTMAADHASGVGFGTETAALQARAQAGLLAAALDGNAVRFAFFSGQLSFARNAVRFAFFSGQLSFARNLTNGTGKRLAAKDAARAASGDHAQTHLERAWTALPEGAEKLTMAQVQQLLAAQGIKGTPDGVAGLDVDAVEQFENGEATAKPKDEHTAAAVDGVNSTLHEPLPVDAATVAQEGGAA